jgi:tetratricopeptide (TPR) repeat protein
MDQQAHYQRISSLALIGLLLFLVSVSVGIYYASLFYGFYFDDHPNITKAFSVRHRHFFDVFFQSSRWISLWLNTLYYRIAHFNPFVYRLGNLIIHLTNGLLVFWVFSLLFKNVKEDSFLKQHALPIAFATAGLFLFHPVATQAVCYVIQGQLEGLSTLATLLMILFFWYCVTAKPIAVRLFCGGLLFGVAALSVGTKEIIIVAPFLIILVDWFFVAQGDWNIVKKHLLLYLAIMFIFFSSFLYTYGIEHFLTLIKLKLEPISTYGNVLTTHRDVSITAFQFLCSQFKVILHYSAIYFWPFGISLDYDWKLADGFWEVDCIIPFLILMCFGVWLLLKLIKNRTDTIVFAWLWFFICLLPRASIIPSSELIADYKTYCASIGILLIIALIVVRVSVWLADKFTRKTAVFWLSIIAFLLPWALVAHRRSLVWRSQEALWRDIVLHAPTKPRAWNNLAVALIDAEKYGEAVPLLEKAINLDRFYPDPWNNLSVVYAHLGNINKAI